MDRRETQVESAGASLALSYSPSGDVALVALHGASEGTREFELYEHLHATLPTRGIGVCTFDRRGEGGSSGEPSLGRFDVQVADCLAIVRSLDVERVGLWGFSQGGWVAPLVGVAEPSIACVATVASCGVSPHEQMLYGVARHLGDAGFEDATVEAVLDLRCEFAAAMRGDLDDERDLAERLRAASEQPWWPLAYLPTVLPRGDARRRWVAEMDFDPAPSFRALRCPVLALYGDRDEWTPVDRSVLVWEAAQGDRVDLAVLTGADHALHDASGELHPGYEPRLVSWLGRTLRRRRSGERP